MGLFNKIKDQIKSGVASEWFAVEQSGSTLVIRHRGLNLLLGYAKRRAGETIEDIKPLPIEGLAISVRKKGIRAVVDITCDELQVDDEDVTVVLRLLGPSVLESANLWMTPVVLVWRLFFGSEFKPVAKLAGLQIDRDILRYTRPASEFGWLKYVLANNKGGTQKIAVKIQDSQAVFELPRGFKFKPDGVRLMQWFVSRDKE